MPDSSDMFPYRIAGFYRFTAMTDCAGLQSLWLKRMHAHRLKGTILLAPEGINGTICGEAEAVDAFLSGLRRDSRFADMPVTAAPAKQMAFFRAKVRLKKEIITMGVAGLSPRQSYATALTPQQWNALLAEKNVIAIDTRNHYEVAVGSFQTALNPHTESFREFPALAAKHLHQHKDKKIAMFCTGGIRCEKAAAYLRMQGFEQIYQLKGGILQYLKQIAPEDSLWQGECFVFDRRVTVTHGLQPSDAVQCFACRMPLTRSDRQHRHYQPHLSCPHCFGKLSTQKKSALKEREKQMLHAERLGIAHPGHAV